MNAAQFHNMPNRVFAIASGCTTKHGTRPCRCIEKIDMIIQEAKRYGMRLAASVAADYDRYNSHPYLVSDCILGKLNLIKGKPRPNKDASKLSNLISDMERRVSSVEGTMRFMMLASKQKKGRK